MEKQKYRVTARIGGWASQIIEATSAEEARKLAITTNHWGYDDYYWWVRGGVSSGKGVPEELEILDVHMVLEEK